MRSSKPNKPESLECDQIVIFDGVCNFCNGAVNFIIARDPRAKFQFTPMQSKFAKELLEKHNIQTDDVDIFALTRGDSVLIFSSAALEIAKGLTGYWYLLSVFKVIPRPIRDFFYKLFARNRYTLFGKSSACMVPSEKVRSRFIGL